ncbi:MULTISPECIES: type I polyketide synthase [Kamptonema]|uniref:type I polyketide synthase n=1 Tax=Kamptonema TaxID=1501433 RepID=UPI0001DAC8F0|nr:MULTISPECIES: type I polyketide synthase [Kamptonema]CBN53834.1 Beta-ketoacyl synthase [Kamptonema sp. PCC 6506]
MTNSQEYEGVAIVGMVGRFPGATNLDELWSNLCNGVESTTFLTDAELDPSIDSQLKSDPNYIKAKGIIKDADKFDADFFGINPREAEIIDPQQRIFLEMAWEALEKAGCNPDTYKGLIGVFAGTGNNTYFANNVSKRPDLIEAIGAFQAMVANEKDFLTTRTSYKLNLKGPSLNIYTACSTSLVTVSNAFYSLLSYQCDMAIAGGISVTVPQNSGYLYQDGGMFSNDGYTRSFEANAQGTVFGNGAGVVVLKRLEDAIADRNYIYAVIKGAATNNDGAGKVSFAAPSVDGQAGAIAMAQSFAGIEPETISYIEAHGTATPLGDPIEIEALTQVFRAQTQKKQFCAIGTIKSNFGHIIAGAGVAGLIKTALSLHHKLIPPTLHFDKPNPKIDFANSPFYVNATLSEWKAGPTPRRAGVSSFGVGGTNAHAVLEEAPPVTPSGPSRPRQLLLLSAKTPSALDAATANLREYLQQDPALNLADVAYTLKVGRKPFNHRRFAVCSSREDALQVLDSLPPQQSATRQTDGKQRPIAFMFPGQGSQYINMGLNLYETEAVFRDTVDECAELLKPHLDLDLRDILYPDGGDAEAATTQLRQTCFTQPALFVVEYALAQLWMSWGIQPQATIGHSIGEFVSACLAGVFSLQDALMLVATRGRLIQSLPTGSMLSVALPAATLEQRLSAEVAIAAINGPSLCVASGATDAIAALESQLASEGITCKHLHTSHAFHSPMMEPIIDTFANYVRQVELKPPQIPFVSTVTASWITAEQATDCLYWAKHLRQTVRFAEGVQELWQNDSTLILLEVGPRTTAATLARKQAKDLKKQVVISSLSDTAVNNSEWSALLTAVGQLWLAGRAIDWESFYAEETRSLIPLPTYPFERKRYWVEPIASIPSAAEVAVTSAQKAIDSQPPLPLPITHSSSTMQTSLANQTKSRKERIFPLLQEVIEETSGLEIDIADAATLFVELGIDSLALTQVGTALQKKFNIKITFRQLLEDFPTLDSLAEFLDGNLPPEVLPAPQETAPILSQTVSESAPPPHQITRQENQNQLPVTNYQLPITNYQVPIANTQPGSLESVVAQQLQLMSKQLDLLGNNHSSSLPSALPVSTPQTIQQSPPILSPAPIGNGSSNGTSSAPTSQNSPPPTEEKKPFGAAARINTQGRELNSQQQAKFEAFVKRYTAKTPSSKKYAQSHRHHLADPRTVSGFNPTYKEIVYPIVVNRSLGSKLWDLDGNEYLDLTNGFGSNFFGYSAPFIVQAIEEQLKQGYEIGPQTPLAGEVAELICELTKLERVAFCNTGSEAVLGAMRLARTVTGRNKIAIFSGAYHGIFDEVIVRGTKKLRSIPASPGIMPEAVENVLIVDYGEPESLEILRNHADELAAIMVEPVQSRRPDLQPKEFLHELRRITEKSGSAFIMDEVITGFRIHPGGSQAYFGVEADIATYGKVVGAGLPIGVIAGNRKFMDALDGGFWQYGDSSFPEVGVTYFAGTFVRHPLVLAAAKAALEYLKQCGPQLQQSLNQKTNKLAADLNGLFEQLQVPFQAKNFGSLFKVIYPPEFVEGELLFYWLREKGIHIWDHRPCFLTIAHSDAELEFVVATFKQSIVEMQAEGFLPSPGNGSKALELAGNGQKQGSGANGSASPQPPVPGAKLGRDPKGNPAWYIPDPERPGKYLQVGESLLQSKAISL